MKRPKPLYKLDRPRTSIFQGDCIQIFRDLPKGKAYQPQLVFADPPYNFDVDYGDGVSDRMDQREYEVFTKGWIASAWRRLLPTGTMFIIVPDEWAGLVDQFCVRGLDMTRINWMIWHYRFGQYTAGRFIRSKVHCLWFAKSSEWKWNLDEVLMPSDRATIYNDARTQETKNPGQRPDLDVWGFDKLWGRIQGNNKERRPQHQNQIPELLASRVIRMTTDPGDVVCDPFVGSGTTPTIARALKRPFFGMELNKASCKSAMQRVKEGPVREV